MACTRERSGPWSMPPGGWCSMPSSGSLGSRTASHGPTNAAAMLSSTIASAPIAVALARTRGASTMPSGKARSRHRHELQSGVVRRRQLGDAAVKQVAARQLAWITQCYQGG